VSNPNKLNLKDLMAVKRSEAETRKMEQQQKQYELLKQQMDMQNILHTLNSPSTSLGVYQGAGGGGISSASTYPPGSLVQIGQGVYHGGVYPSILADTYPPLFHHDAILGGQIVQVRVQKTGDPVTVVCYGQGQAMPMYLQADEVMKLVDLLLDARLKSRDDYLTD